jgi:hypothetical protein
MAVERLSVRGWLCLTLLVGGAMGTGPADAKNCRRDEVPPGVRLPQQVGCEPRSRAPTTATRPVQSGRQPGVIMLGNGTELRVSGQADIEVRHRR